MINVLWITLWISLVYATGKKCTQFHAFMTAGEPGSLCCPAASELSNSVTWYRNGSDIPISTYNYSRIHQRGNFLWFIPTSMEDSGVYECSVNGSERIGRPLKVLKNFDGLCFNQDTIFNQKLPSRASGKLTCPIEKNFEGLNALRDLQWYKGCSHRLRKDEKYPILGSQLVIRNTTKEDEGMYLCQAQFAYMEKQYNVSRSVNLTVFAQCNEPANLIYPRNYSIEADLGSSVLMDCNVSTCSEVLIYWTVNGKPLQDFSSTYEVVPYKRSILNVGIERDQPKKWITGVKFNIAKTRSEDYLEFTCVVETLDFYGLHSSAYIVLNRPGLKIQSYLIGGLASPLFLILASVLVYKFFKVDIVLWYRSSCQPLLRKEVSDGKLYDAYVLYPKNVTNCSYSPDIFVLKVLPDVLEKQCGYNLYIFGRDDLPGQAVVNIVDETIQRSRRVILVLLPGVTCCSAPSETSEQHIAMYSALIQNGIKVILIELDKIPDYTNMPESIKYLKQKHGVLTWRGDFSEKSQMATSRFWKNVRYRMPASQIPPSSDPHWLPVFFKSAPISEG